jgi:hypothetical protein
MPRLHDPDPDLPVLTFLDDACGAGLSRHQVRHRLRSGDWHPLTRGAYLPAGHDTWGTDDRYARERIEHALRAVAAARRNRGTVVTDASAAILHGLPVLNVPTRVQLAVPADKWSGSRSGIDFRVRRFDADEIVQARVPVASPVRCWLDIARFGTLREALVTGDAGARTGLISPEASAVDPERWRGQWGCRRLLRALQFVDGTRESPLESSSFGYFVENQVPVPRMQMVITSGRGVFIARVDFLWDDRQLVGEADGKLKYADSDQLYAEKRREDLIRAEGFRVVRWGWSDLRTTTLARRLRRLLT